MHPPEFAFPNLGAHPLLFGPPPLVDGYYQLEEAERHQGMNTITSHGKEVAVWYRLLSLHQEALLRGFHFDCPREQLEAHGLQMQLLGLGLTSSKAALDLLLVGYYSIGYAAIRHMIESWLFCRYVGSWPKTAQSFYAPKDGSERSPGRPPTRNIAERLAAQHPEGAELFKNTFRSWEAMSNGSHPSGIGIVQVHGERDGRAVLGATYNPNMWQDGISHGLPAAWLLIHELGILESQGPTWEADVVAIGQRLDQAAVTRRSTEM